MTYVLYSHIVINIMYAKQYLITMYKTCSIKSYYRNDNKMIHINIK